jgi:hypothetical protein
MEGKSRSIDFWDFYEERRKTFLSHRSVRPERLLLDIVSSAFTVIQKKSRTSVLPRIAGLPSRFSMSVQSSLRVKVSKDHELFIVTISTPDPQHHKHKEFSGKIRAIRYLWDSRQEHLLLDNCAFLAIIDGSWSDKQVRMLANAGWSVCGWDDLSTSIKSITEFFNAK